MNACLEMYNIAVRYIKNNLGFIAVEVLKEKHVEQVKRYISIEENIEEIIERTM